jgi:7,8-dihydropterin-6-yl-methyl-4-(beta-D-ribofuranosyl)aminobenzene 5'-phosphate synthase
MKITVLNENVIGHKNAKVCLAEWGLSLFIQFNGINILFDTGHTDIYKKNADALGIDLAKTDFIILSHNHWDHTGGLRFHNFTDKKKLITHPDVLIKLPKEQSDKIKNDFNLVSSKKSLEFTKNIFYLGEIPRINNYEFGNYKNDRMLDDSAIVIRTDKGAIVITGCSHSGICNICDYAKIISGQNLHAVIGGFHLFEENKYAIEKTIEYFKKEKPRILAPMHCVDFPTQVKFHLNFGSQKYSTGDILELN